MSKFMLYEKCSYNMFIYMLLVPGFLTVLMKKPVFNNLDLFEIQVRWENRGSVTSYVIWGLEIFRFFSSIILALFLGRGKHRTV